MKINLNLGPREALINRDFAIFAALATAFILVAFA
jgi:hypothetical protein